MLLLAVACGCDGTTTRPSPAPREAKQTVTPEPQPPNFAPPPDPNAPAPTAKSVEPPPEVEMVREPARAGVTGKGNYDATIIGTPLTAHFSLKEQIIFDVAIPKALTLFEQTRNRKVRSHQEFMEEIIGKSNIRLPPLPPQYRYVYDPDRGELMVERPKSAE